MEKEFEEDFDMSWSIVDVLETLGVHSHESAFDYTPSLIGSHDRKFLEERGCFLVLLLMAMLVKFGTTRREMQDLHS
jgi:hypothetical protein